MSSPQSLDLLPHTFDPIVLIETWLMFVAIVVFSVYHTHAFLCRILGVPENWIKLLLKIMIKRAQTRNAQ